MTKTEALWDSFCHWTDNWDSALHTKERKIDLTEEACACCQKYMVLSGCTVCPLKTYEMQCLNGLSPYWIARRAAKLYATRARGKGILFGKAAVDMALVLYLLYIVEGGR